MSHGHGHAKNYEIWICVWIILKDAAFVLLQDREPSTVVVTNSRVMMEVKLPSESSERYVRRLSRLVKYVRRHNP